jgi:hypothetical protein
MGAISQDLSSAAMAAAIEASWVGAFGHWSRTPRIEVHDEEPDLRWYVTLGVPVALFNHAYYTRLANVLRLEARLREHRGLRGSRFFAFARRGVLPLPRAAHLKWETTPAATLGCRNHLRNLQSSKHITTREEVVSMRTPA